MYATDNHSLQTLKTAAIEMELRTKKGNRWRFLKSIKKVSEVDEKRELLNLVFQNLN
jgi:hypothetical protein